MGGQTRSTPQAPATKGKNRRIRDRACSLSALRPALSLALAAALAIGVASCAGGSGSGTLHVGTSGDYAPFSLRAGTGEPIGFDIDLARAFARDTGRRLRFVRFGWPLLLRDLEAGRFDVAMSGVTVRPDRSLAGRFTVPVATSGAVVLAPIGQPLPGIAALDRGDLRVGVNRGGHLERVTRARFPRAEIVAFDRNAEVPEALARGEVDAIVSDTLEAPHWQSQLGGAQLLGPFTRDRKAWLVRRENGALAGELDRWVLAREADGTLEAMRRKHFGEAAGAQDASPVNALLAAVDERLSLMPWVADAKRAMGRAVEDLAQEARVLDAATNTVLRASSASNRAALSPEAVRGFFAAQIEAAKSIQRRRLSSPAADTTAPDLEGSLRPALGRISERIAWLLLSLPPCEGGDGCGPDAVLALTVSALERHELGPEHLSAIARSLAELGL